MREFEAPDWRALHSSATRRKRFRFCPVGYYLYHVPGRDGYGAPPESWSYALYAAKFRIPMRSWVRTLWLESIRNSVLPEENPRRLSAPVLARNRLEREIGMLVRKDYQRDPKFVPTVMEFADNIFSAEMLYARSMAALEELIEVFEHTEWAEFLPRLPQIVFERDEFLAFPLGGVELLLRPLVMYRWRGKMVILDTANFDSEEERSRTAELYRAGIRLTRHIPPEHLELHFISPETGREVVDPEGKEALDEFFGKLYAEAVMMRDYLLRQYDCAAKGEWRFPRFDQCGKCRFAGLCTAKSGTPEPERGVYGTD